MINFRFHIVSLIAIFLALALGIVIGAGVIDRGIVDTLDNRINTIEAKADRIQLENDILNAAVDRDSATIEALQPYVLVGRLTGEQVAFVAVRGCRRGAGQRFDRRGPPGRCDGDRCVVDRVEVGEGGRRRQGARDRRGRPGPSRHQAAGAAAWEIVATRLARPPSGPRP